MKTCGDCGHFENGKHGKYGYCRCDVPVWVYRDIDNIAGTTACSSDDAQATDCDKFSYKPVRAESNYPTSDTGVCPYCHLPAGSAACQRSHP
jgi:hypothetical protein